MIVEHSPKTDRDYKLDACIAYANANFKTPSLKVRELDTILKAFRYNVSRVRYLMITPAVISYTAMQFQRHFDIAALEVTGSLDETESPLETTQEIRERHEQVYNEKMQRDYALLHTDQWNARAIKTHEIGAIAVNMLARAPFGTEGFEVLLTSLVVGAWSAFESIAGDLWEQALNLNPTLAQLKKSNRLKKNSKSVLGVTTGSKDDNQSKSVDLDLIQFYNFDLRNKMGTILRRRYEFSRLSSIREAYAAAFSTDTNKIDSALKDDSLDALNAVRNVLVHNAARVDEEYLRRGKSVRTLPKAGVNELLPLDGDVVVGLIKPALIQASNLLGAVDDWLHKHKRT